MSSLSEQARANDFHLYHNLAANKLLSILTGNSLVLSLSDTNSSEKGGPKTYYMSLARSVFSGYIADRSPGLHKVNEPCVIVFNTHKLERIRGVQIKSTQYWNAADGNGRHMDSGREMEERLFSDNMVIHDIIKAIVEIRLIVLRDDPPVAMRKVFSFAKKKGIPVKLFTMKNFQGFLLGKEKPADRALVFEQLKAIKSDKPMHRGSLSLTRIMYDKGGYAKESSYLFRMTEFVYKNSMKELTKKARSELHDLVRRDPRYGDNGFANRYRSDIHNLRAGRLEEKVMYAKMFKHMKAKSAKDFFAKLEAKWYPLLYPHEPMFQ